jgi:hypothetical protein
MYYGFAYVPIFIYQIVLWSKSNLLSKDFVHVFLLVFHTLEYHHGYDSNSFLDKPCLLMKPLV